MVRVLSVQLLRALADYHKAAGEKDKAKADFDRIIKLRPDDAQLRYQVAQQLVEAGVGAAIGHEVPVADRSAIENLPQLRGEIGGELRYLIAHRHVRQRAGESDTIIAALEA